MKNIIKKQALTLVEISIAVIVIGVLAAVAIPKYNSMMQKARDKEVGGVAQALALAELRYLGQNGNLFPNTNCTVGESDINNGLNLGNGFPNQQYRIKRITDKVIIYTRNVRSRICTLEIPYAGTPTGPTFAASTVWPDPLSPGSIDSGDIGEKPVDKPEDIGEVPDHLDNIGDDSDLKPEDINEDPKIEPKDETPVDPYVDREESDGLVDEADLIRINEEPLEKPTGSPQDPIIDNLVTPDDASEDGKVIIIK